MLSLACVGYFAWLAPPDAVEHVTHTGGGTGRTTIWAVGWRMVEAHPFTGIGADNFQISSIHYLLRPGALTRTDFIVEKPKVAHNTYLEVLATLGIVGLLMFLSILAFAIRQTVRAVRSFARRGDYKMGHDRQRLSEFAGRCGRSAERMWRRGGWAVPLTLAASLVSPAKPVSEAV